MKKKGIALVIVSVVLTWGSFTTALASDNVAITEKYAEELVALEESPKAEKKTVAVIDCQGNEVFTANVDTASAKGGLQKAFDYVRDNGSASNIMTVKLPAGTYMVNSSMDIYSNTIFDLSSGAVLKRNRNIVMIYMGRYAEDTTAYNGVENVSIIGNAENNAILDGNGKGKSILRFAHAQSIKIQNIRFANVQKGHHMEFSASKEVTVDSCRFDGFSPADYTGRSNYEALQIDILLPDHFAGFPPYDGTVSSDINITNNVFDGVCRGVGTHSAEVGKYISNVSITDNIFKNNMGYAIATVNYIQSDISNNKIENCGAGILFRHMIWDTGINYYDGDINSIATDLQTTISNNQISIVDTGFEGDCYGIYAYGEEVTTPKSWSSAGVSGTVSAGDYRVKKVTITGNLIVVANVANAVRFTGACDCILSNNRLYTFTNHKLSGFCDTVRLEKSADNTIVNNIIEDKSESASFIRNAIQIENDSDRNVVQKNRIISALNCGIYVENASDNVISENTVTNVPTAAVYVNTYARKKSNTTIVKNTFENTGKYGIVGENRTNMTVTENTITNCSQFGVRFGQGSKGTVQDNIFKKCKNGNVCVQQGGNKVLKVGNAKIISITSKKKKLTIKWKTVKDAKKYDVYRSTSRHGKYKKIATVSDIKYIDKKVKKGKKYYYKIVPVTTVGKVVVYGGNSPVKGATVKE